MSQIVSPLNLERYELKYLIPLSMVGPISKTVEQYCQMDHYSEVAPDNFYTINSLYLDTPSYFLFRTKEVAGAFNFNMRVRAYGDGMHPPYFCEIKYKLREFVKKHRAKLSGDDWVNILEFNIIPEDLDVISKKNLEDFLYMKLTYNVQPVILTQYRRKAYLSELDDYARVTFDRDLRYQEINSWCLQPNEKSMCHYDHLDSFENTGENVVLELKCEKKIPMWMVDLIRTFNLDRGSFSKFGNSLTSSLIIPDVLASGILYR